MRSRFISVDAQTVARYGSRPNAQRTLRRLHVASYHNRGLTLAAIAEVLKVEHGITVSLATIRKDIETFDAEVESAERARRLQEIYAQLRELEHTGLNALALGFPETAKDIAARRLNLLDELSVRVV